MSLEEYLQEKLNISLEKSKEIVEVFHEYKKEYGHHSHHMEGKTTNNHSFETYNLDNPHCNGCTRNCVLSNPNCDIGKRLQEEVLNKNKQ